MIVNLHIFECPLNEIESIFGKQYAPEAFLSGIQLFQIAHFQLNLHFVPVQG